MNRHFRGSGVVAVACVGLALLTFCQGASAGPFAIRSSVPTTLSLQRAPTGAYRLTHSGKDVAEITIEGLAKEGDVVYEVLADGSPGAKVSATLVGDRLTFTAEPETSYAIGPPDAVLSPSVNVSLEPDDVLAAKRKSKVRVEIRNYYRSPLKGAVSLEAPTYLNVEPGRERKLNVKKKGAAKVVFTVSKPELTIEDVLRGKDEMKIVVKPEGGLSIEKPLTLRIEDNPVRSGFVIETENVAAEAEEGQAITIRDDKVNMSGKAFSGWNDKDHWLEWKFNLPEVGKYHLAFRFSVGGHVAHRDFKLDGEYPHEACRDIPFPDTGGWANEKNDWRHYIVKDADGRPIVLQLAAGDHTIRMNPILGDGGCNLDYILLIPVSP